MHIQKQYFKYLLVSVAIQALLFNSSSAYAANECGAGVAGGTVTCNGDGTPATDNGNYTAGITYTTGLNLIVDGTNTPLVSNGRIGITSATGAQTTTILGDVTLNIVNPATAVTGIGDFNAHSRSMTLDIGPDVKLNMSQSVAARALYGVSARAVSAPVVVNSSAAIDLISSNGGTTGNWRAYNLYASGVNSSINATIGGSINVQSNNGGGTTSRGIYAYIVSSTGGSSVNVNNTATIDITSTGSYNGSIMGIDARNTGGGIYINSGGEININAAASTYAVGVYTFGAQTSSVVDINAGINITANANTYGAYILATTLAQVNQNADMNITSTSASTSNYSIGTIIGATPQVHAINVADNVSTNVTGNAYVYSFFAEQGGVINLGENTSTVINSGAYGDVFALYNGTQEINIGDGAYIENNATTAARTFEMTNAIYDITIGEDVEMNTTSANEATTFAFAQTLGGDVFIGNNSTIYNDGGTSSTLFNGSLTGVDNLRSYGILTGNIQMNGGNDTVALLGGSLTGAVEMGTGDDSLVIANMDAAGLSGITHLDGGDGEDTLTFSGITASGATLSADDPAYGINLGTAWETINLFDNSAWTLTNNLTLGGSTLNIDSTSTLFAGNGINPVISAVIPGDTATVNNAGIIDLSNGGFSTADTLTIIGDYVGNGGTLLVDVNNVTNSTDQLIIDGSNGGGSATGTTNIALSPASLGGNTTGNGILIVNAINGATIGANAFTLAGSSSAGAYSYGLNEISDSLYLSATLRNEVLADMAMSGMAHHYGLAMMGTLDRRNPLEQQATTKNYAFWGRSFGEQASISNDGNFAKNGPAYDYDMYGLQLGVDLYSEDATEDKAGNTTGIYAGTAYIDADVKQAGVAKMNGYSLGAYWTYQAPRNQWYVDSVVQGTYYGDAHTRSIDGEGISTSGKGFAVSSEVGYPVFVAHGLRITPNAQILYQSVKIDDAANAQGRVAFSSANALYGRIGTKIEKTWKQGENNISFWVSPDLWHTLSDNGKTTFSNTLGTTSDSFNNGQSGDWAQIGFGGSIGTVGGASFFASADYAKSLRDAGDSLSGRVGVKIKF